MRKQENDTGLEQAIQKYKEALEIDAHYAVAQAKLSWAYLRFYGLHGDGAALALARDNSESALSLNPNLVEAHLALAWAMEQSGELKSASREMSKALSLDPSNPHTLIYQARFYADSGQYKQAEETFTKVLRLRPNLWLAHSEYGVLLDNEGRYSEALLQFRSASLAAPRNALARSNIGSVYLELGKLDEAIQNCQSSLNLGLNDGAALGLATASRILRHYTDAVEYARTAVKLGAASAINWLDLGDVYTATGRFTAEAVAAYKRAVAVEQEELRTQPNNGPGWMLLALCRVKTGDHNAADEMMNRANKLHSDDIQSQLFKVRTLELLGRRDEALENIGKILRRGATPFQFQAMPDLERVRTDPRYLQLVQSTTSSPTVSFQAVMRGTYEKKNL